MYAEGEYLPKERKKEERGKEFVGEALKRTEKL
jgi:hypothetical protein